MIDRPTPETDAETIYCDAMPNMPWVDADICRKLERERDEARQALMKIEDLFIDGTDIYADRENMGIIARAALEGAK